MFNELLASALTCRLMASAICRWMALVAALMAAAFLFMALLVRQIISTMVT